MMRFSRSYPTHEDVMIRSPFPRMTDMLTPGESAPWKLEVYEVTEQEESFSKMRAASGHDMEFCPKGKYMILKRGSTVVMSDTMMERDTNLRAFNRARGHVLIGGLGMGMLMCGIQKKPEVSSVTVVEKDQTLIDMMMKCGLHIDEEKTVIVQGDVFTWEPGFKFKYDYLYFDIWDNICEDNVEEFKKLRKLYRKYRAKGSLINFWCEDVF